MKNKSIAWPGICLCFSLILLGLFMLISKNQNYDYVYCVVMIGLIYMFYSISFYVKEVVRGVYIKKVLLSGSKFYKGETISANLTLNRYNRFSKKRKMTFIAVDENDKSVTLQDNDIVIPRKSNVLSAFLKPDKRGLFKLCYVTLSTKDLFNIAESTHSRNQKQFSETLLVLPAPLKSKKIESVFIKVVNNFTNKQHKMGIKEYQRGDRFKDINWKQSAAKNTLMTNEFYGEVKTKITLDVDLICNKENKEAFERMLGHLIFLLDFSEYKNHIDNVVLGEKKFNLTKQKRKLLEEIATVKSIVEDDDTQNNKITEHNNIKDKVILTTREKYGHNIIKVV